MSKNDKTNTNKDNKQKGGPLNFKPGDWIATPGTKAFRVLAVIDKTDTSPKLYALWAPFSSAGSEVAWVAEPQLAEQGPTKHKPDIKQWQDIEAGDKMLVFDKSHTQELKVLARVGEAVLLSQPYDNVVSKLAGEASDMMKKINGEGETSLPSFITELIGGMTHDKKKQFARTGEWVSVHELAFGNRHLVKAADMEEVDDKPQSLDDFSFLFGDENNSNTTDKGEK